MSLRSKVLALVEVVLRVPPLFVVDEFLKISLGLPVSSGEEVLVLSNVTVDHVDIPETDGNYYDANFYNAFFFTFFKFVVCCLGKLSFFRNYSYFNCLKALSISQDISQSRKLFTWRGNVTMYADPEQVF